MYLDRDDNDIDDTTIYVDDTSSFLPDSRDMSHPRTMIDSLPLWNILLAPYRYHLPNVVVKSPLMISPHISQ